MGWRKHSIRKHFCYFSFSHFISLKGGSGRVEAASLPLMLHTLPAGRGAGALLDTDESGWAATAGSLSPPGQEALGVPGCCPHSTVRMCVWMAQVQLSAFRSDTMDPSVSYMGPREGGNNPSTRTPGISPLPPFSPVPDHQAP